MVGKKKKKKSKLEQGGKGVRKKVHSWKQEILTDQETA